jgi:type IV pilus assembly protein PilA
MHRSVSAGHSFPPQRDVRAGVRRRRGFTLMEMMVVVAIIAILATLAIPGNLNRRIMDEITSAVPLADIAKPPIALGWAAAQEFPADNASAGLPSADKIVNTYINAVAVQNGAIQITFGNSANSLIAGKVLTLRPAVVEDAPIVPITWICGNASAPDKMTIKGENKTSVPVIYLPFNCRSPGT